MHINSIIDMSQTNCDTANRMANKIEALATVILGWQPPGQPKADPTVVSGQLSQLLETQFALRSSHDRIGQALEVLLESFTEGQEVAGPSSLGAARTPRYEKPTASLADIESMARKLAPRTAGASNAVNG